MDSAAQKIGDVVGGVLSDVAEIKNNINNLMIDEKTRKKDEAAAEKLLQEDAQKNFRAYIESFPRAKVYEFKPQDTLGANISIITTGMKMIDAMMDSSGNGADIMIAIIDEINNFLIKEFKIDLTNASTFADPKTRAYGMPNKMYKNLISGYFTAYYEIPVLTYDDYLVSNGSAGWTAQGFSQRFLGETVGTTVKSFMSDKIGSGFDIATRPKWQIDGGGDGRDGITMNVMLFNDNLGAVFKNLAFIHSFVAGNLWYQDTFIQKCSSLYDVEVPGRFRYYFCTCDIMVKCVGKNRKICKTSDYSALTNRFNLNEVNIEVLDNIPDAWEIEFKFKSVIPNNFNSYIAYTMSSFENQVQVGQRVGTIFEQLANSVKTRLDSEQNKRDNAAKQEGVISRNNDASLGGQIS
jgi:hypothetical protein